MKKLSLGILAHVDAGKTTLTESVLLDTGMIRTAGRVDNGDAFLDTEALEKKRGVTILSKQAICTLSRGHELNKSDSDVRITIIDTPGHTDFIGEAERVLGVLDAAVLLISGPDGVTASTRRLAGMLKTYRVPYYVFVNKMDMCERPEEELLAELTENLGEGFLGCDSAGPEDIASLSEDTIEKYLETGELSHDDVVRLIFAGKYHPVVFGSALKNSGVDRLVELVTENLPDISYKESFSAKVFKIGYEDGHKLAFVKVTGGSIPVRSEIEDERLRGEKITQIRSYSGGRYESPDRAEAGDVVTLVGLEGAYAGMGLGEEPDEEHPLCQPVLRYDLEIPEEVPQRVFLPKLKELAAEDPLLQLEVTEEGRVSISVMGEFQMEILKETVRERYGVAVDFVKGSLIYKETIRYPIVGFGHFEPLRHYSEVQILMEPLPRGSGIEVASDLSVNVLGINWQKTIISTLTEHLPAGVLTGSALTDIRFTLIAGKAHLKHTDSQDFRESVRRAVRQGLMKTESILLEPEYDFVIHTTPETVGRVITDVSEMGGRCSLTEDGTLAGAAPARCISDYQAKLTQFTSGSGSVELRFAGYADMPEDVAEEVITEKAYDPEADKMNPPGSIFCAHGVGYYVPWYEAEALMHLPSMEADYLELDVESEEERLEREAELARRVKERQEERGSLEEGLRAMGTDEIDDILRSATHSNAGKENRRTKRVYLTRRTVQAERRAAGQTTGAGSGAGLPGANAGAGGGAGQIGANGGIADGAGQSGTNSGAAQTGTGSRTAQTGTGNGAGQTGTGSGAPQNSAGYGAPQSGAQGRKRNAASGKNPAEKKKYLLVDGYNIIHAWKDLKVLLEDEKATVDRRSLSMESARYKLLDMMSEYRAMKGTEVIVVFDAYNVRGHRTEKMDYLGVHVVYTKQAETADQYIARFTVENSRNFDITVATSDGLIQLIICGENCRILSARDLEMDYQGLRSSLLE